MSRLRGIALRALSAALTVGSAAGAVSSGCAGRGGPAPAREAAPGEAQEADTPVTCTGTGQNGYNRYKYLYWGNLHQHTALSLDAYAWGTSTMPRDAYAFAKAPLVPLAVGGSGGVSIRSQRALDFLAITDHSEWTAVTDDCLNPATDTGCSSINYNPAGLDNADHQAEALCGSVLPSKSPNGKWPDPTVMSTTCFTSSGDPPAYSGPYWDFWQSYVIGAANDAYTPCTFTSLVAYEWSGMTSGLDGTGPGTGYTNHRNVIFNNGTSANLPASPCDALYCAPSPSFLWSSLDATCNAQNDCAAVAIPHNSNESNGEELQYAPSGSTLMRQQSQYQVSVEIYQHKGNSECYPYQGVPKLDGAPPAAVAPPAFDDLQYPVSYGNATADIWCQFEQSSFLNTYTPNTTPPVNTYQANSFVRGALESGTQVAALAGQGVQGQNPLQLGIVGATDDHNAAPGYVEEEVFVGHHGNTDDSATQRVDNGFATFGSGGLTGVWAEQNTRDRIFAAIQRRETYATSGPRIQVRFYQTAGANVLGSVIDADFPRYLVEHGGVPMGGTFGPANLGDGTIPEPPAFVIQAVADTGWPQASPAAGGLAGGWCNQAADCAANAQCRNSVCVAPVPLSTVQIIKAYSVSSKGTVTTTEDPPYTATATDIPNVWTWTDSYPSAHPPGTFDRADYTFYYVRVLQAPTYRWSHWDCHPKPAGACAVTSDCSTGDTCSQGLCIPPAPSNCGNLAAVDAGYQERAWTSPIWYSPVLQYAVVAGSGVAGDSTDPVPAVPPPAGGPAAQIGNAGAYYLSGMAKDASGNLYIADAGNAVIRKVDPWGLMTIFAGTNGKPGYTTDPSGLATGPGTTINGPSGVAVDSNGNVYFSEFNNNDVRVVDTQGHIWTYASLLGQPTGIAIDGNDNIYVAMAARETIVQLTAAVNSQLSRDPGAVTAWTAGPPPTPGNLRWLGSLNTSGYNQNEEAGASSTATVANGLVNGAYGNNVLLSNPNGVWADASGNVYINDSGNSVIRKVTTKSQGSPANLAGYPVPYQVTTIAGSHAGLTGNTAATQTLKLRSQYGVVADGGGNVFIADTYNNRIVRVDASGNFYVLTPGTKGSFLPNFSGTAAAVAGTTGLALDGPGYSWMDRQGAMYFADQNAAIYKLSY